ncbi:MAG: IS30 family transposase, partial [Clostridia bacterium]|nr:IS30 family transposase [Clostridia bacterium]
MILQNHPEITLCEKTIYNYIDSGVLSVGNLELPKNVKYKLRKSHETTINDSGIFVGLTYKDFLAFIKENHDIRITE